MVQVPKTPSDKCREFELKQIQLRPDELARMIKDGSSRQMAEENLVREHVLPKLEMDQAKRDELIESEGDRFVLWIYLDPICQDSLSYIKDCNTGRHGTGIFQEKALIHDPEHYRIGHRASTDVDAIKTIRDGIHDYIARINRLLDERNQMIRREVPKRIELQLESVKRQTQQDQDLEREANVNLVRRPKEG